jgi:hypothetical protein
LGLFAIFELRPCFTRPGSRARFRLQIAIRQSQFCQRFVGDFRQHPIGWTSRMKWFGLRHS